MAYFKSINPLVLYSLIALLALFSHTKSQPSLSPKTPLLILSKHTSTKNYITKIPQGTPPFTTTLTLDLGGATLWLRCDSRAAASSTSRRLVSCSSPKCKLSPSPNPCPSNSTAACAVLLSNPRIPATALGNLSSDSLALQTTTDGHTLGSPVTVGKFLSSCSSTFLALALASEGIAGLGRAKLSLTSQLSAALGFRNKVAVCLSSNNGVVFFGDGINVSELLTHTTPLISNPSEYIVGVKSLAIDGNVVPINASLLSRGVMFSTIDPYTVLETSIFNTFSAAYTAALAAKNVSRVAQVSPFKVCYSTANLKSTNLGFVVPEIRLVMDGGVVWTIFGANSLVSGVREGMACLGFMDGGRRPRRPIVIGGFQMENNLVQFDLEASRVGFSGLLFRRQTSCDAYFNFTSSSNVKAL